MLCTGFEQKYRIERIELELEPTTGATETRRTRTLLNGYKNIIALLTSFNFCVVTS